MYLLDVVLLLFSLTSTILGEKDISSAAEEKELKIGTPAESNETTTILNNVKTEFATTASVNKDILTTTEHYEVQQTESSKEPQLRSAVTDDHLIENNTVFSSKSVDTELRNESDIHAGNVTKYTPKDNFSDEIEDYDVSKMPNFNVNYSDNNVNKRELERRKNGHQNVYRRTGSENNGHDKGHHNDTVGELFVELKHIKNDSTNELKTSVGNVGESFFENNTVKLQNEDSTESQLRSAAIDKDLTEYIPIDDISLETYNNPLSNHHPTIHPTDHNSKESEEHESEVKSMNEFHSINENSNILLDLKYRSGKAEKKINDQEAVANVTPPIATLPSIRMVSSEITGEDDKTIDDYNNQISSNAYAYRPLKVNKKVKKPNNDSYTERKPAVAEEIKDDFENKKTRRKYDNMYKQHPVYLPQNIELSSSDTWKKGFNIEFQDLPKPALADHEFTSYRYENFPSYLVAKLNPDFTYRSRQLRLGVDHPPASINDLVSNLNHLLANAASFPNVSKEKQLNSLPQTQNKYKQIPWPLTHDSSYLDTVSDNLRNHEQPQGTKLQNDERYFNQKHVKDVNLNPFSGVTPRLRDGRRSGVPNKLKWLIAQQRRSRRRRRRRYCLQSRRSILKKRRLLIALLRSHLNN